MGILRSIGKGLVAIVGEARQDGQESGVKKRGRATANPFAVSLSNAERASLDCGNAEKRSALASGGVDVFGLSKEKIVFEAVALLNELCGQKLSSQNKPSSVKTDWANLTKTGKTPKKVAECHVIFDWKSGDSTICHIWYGRDLEPYAADVYVWRGNKRHDYIVRTVEGSMVVQHEALYDADKDFRKVLY